MAIFVGHQCLAGHDNALCQDVDNLLGVAVSPDYLATVHQLAKSAAAQSPDFKTEKLAHFLSPDSNVRYRGIVALSRKLKKGAVATLEYVARNDPDPTLRLSAITYMAHTALELDRAILLSREVLWKSNSEESLSCALSAARSLEDKGAKHLIEKALSHENGRLRSSAAGLFSYLFPEQATQRLRSMVKDSDPEVQNTITLILADRGMEAPRVQFLKNNLENSDIGKAVWAAEELISRGHPISSAQMSRLISRGNAIKGTGKDSVSFLRNQFTLFRIGVIAAEAEHIKHGHLSDVDLKQRILEPDFILSGMATIELIRRRSPVLEELLGQSNLPQHLRDLIEPRTQLLRKTPKFHPLYQKVGDSFWTESLDLAVIAFEKSHSELYLLGGKLAGKIVARVVSKTAYENWRRAFDNKAVWKSAGFDYVPIEAIQIQREVAQHYKLTETEIATLAQLEKRYLGSDKVVVYARVIHGPTLHALTDTRIPGAKKLLAAEQRIFKVLHEILGIDHGHLHDDNYVVEEQGGNLRLYLIDFDLATPVQSSITSQ